MFAGDRQMGAELSPEEYGPPVPTSTQVAVQTARDVVTSNIPLTKMNVLYIAGGAIALYVAWQYFFKDMLPDENY